MTIALVAINAKYIHSALGVYSLYAYLSEEEKRHVRVMEFTINQAEDFIVSEILRAQPDVLAFSCYIWNIGLVESLIETFKKVLPEVPIVLGGPEVFGDTAELWGVDAVVQGEGEEAFRALVRGRMENLGNEAVPLDTIPFSYPNFDHLANRIIYYETSRGCVNRCGFCLSSATTGVRFLSMERVKEDLDKFLAASVKQVKFVDRTFNCHKPHAMEIWQYLIKHDNGTTNFHFEIAGELLDDEMLNILGQARKGLFQFEIGVQSTNPQTLKAIKRKTNTTKIFDNVAKLKSYKNIHLHLDLIVGLPHENYESFKKSFNDVFACRPHKLQLGFLKLLKGSQLRIEADKHGILYKNHAPYNVLQTNDITFAEINLLHKIEHMLETFYNGTGFSATVEFLLQNFPSPFGLFHDIALHWEEEGYHLVSHKKMALYTFLYNFASHSTSLRAPLGAPEHCEFVSIVRELLKYDMLCQENVRTFPQWIDEYYQPDNLKITRTTAIHTFEYDICKWLSDTTKALAETQCSVAFDYTKAERSSLHASITNVIPST